MTRQLVISIAMVAAISLAMAAALVFGMRAWDKQHQPMPKFGVLDIAAIMKAKESQFTAMILKPGATDDDKKRAYELVRSFGNDLSTIIKALPDECRCIVLNKAAFVAGAADDLTPGVKLKLRLP